MTVAQLIEQLQHQPQDMEVMTAFDYGDRRGTQAVNPIEDVEALDIAETAYSDSGWAIARDENDDDPEEMREVVVLMPWRGF